ncbi:hypothetical protein HYT24_00445 [Candidatus Pacearchaeota archaeon]|nr:hypothetical protein [Candidatus Pacearchaeota archaeon]
MKKKDFLKIFKKIEERREIKVKMVLAVLLILLTVTVFMGLGSTFNIRNLVAVP